MKCVRCKETGLVTRVTDQRAAQLVEAGTHEFAPKEAWKRGGRK